MSACEDIRGRLWAWLDGELDPEGRAEVAAHLERCAECARDAASARALLEAVREGARETAPPELAARVEAIVRGAAAARGAPRAAPGRPRRRWPWLVPLAAALAAILIARPWAGDAGGALAAPGFVADHAAHAARAPSAEPFRPGADAPPAPPALAGGRLRGLSRCVVDGRTYAHWTFDVEGGRVSAFVPVEGRLSGSIDPLTVDGAAVATVETSAGPTVLVSTDLDVEALRALSPGA